MMSKHESCEEGEEPDGVGGLNLPMCKDEHRAVLKFSPRVHNAINRRKKTREVGKRAGGAGVDAGVQGSTGETAECTW